MISIVQSGENWEVQIEDIISWVVPTRDEADKAVAAITKLLKRNGHNAKVNERKANIAALAGNGYADAANHLRGLYGKSAN